jgi:membrane associated rhomboid family serine protease
MQARGELVLASSWTGVLTSMGQLGWHTVTLRWRRTPVLAAGVALVDLAFHTTNPDLGFVLFMVGVVMALAVIGVAVGMLLAVVLPPRRWR